VAGLVLETGTQAMLKLQLKPTVVPFLPIEQFSRDEQSGRIASQRREPTPPLWIVEVVVINESRQVVRMVKGTVFVGPPESEDASSGVLCEGRVPERLVWPSHSSSAVTPEHPVVLETQREVELFAQAGDGHLTDGNPEDALTVRAEVRTDDGRLSSERTVVRRVDIIRRLGDAFLI
jgi:hypothetical protein